MDAMLRKRRCPVFYARLKTVMENLEETISSGMEISVQEGGIRLDVFLAEFLEDLSRSFVAKMIREGRVRINGRVCDRPSRQVVTGETVQVELPEPPRETPVPEDIPVDILYEDEHVIVINKPSGMVVHPAPGHPSGTLVNALLGRYPELAGVPPDPRRPGIVHRLDRDTSGVMVVARSARAYASLSEQASAHTFERYYLALVKGEFREDLVRVDAPLGRSLSDPKRVTVTGIRAREAVTWAETLERYGVASLLRLRLETGRTHQIRVHMRFAGRPILGDPVYGFTNYAELKISTDARTALERLQGQALHAARLGFTHPGNGDKLVFETEPPTEFQMARDALRRMTTL